ncbi:glycosyltransferase [bacterium]|nr:glycosyltransferase [bacterium]
MPKVSVIIPVYNVEKYLRQCLDSVVNQTLQDIEIICVNDGSTDSSLQVLEEYAQNDFRIKIVNKSNSGYGASMNVGLNNATGEYIGIVEPDDFIGLDMYENFYKTAYENNLDFVKGYYYEYCSLPIEKNELVANYDRNKICNRILKPIEYPETFVGGASIWSAIYKRDFLIKNNIRFLETPGASFQDTSFWIKVLFSAERGMFIDKAYNYYRIDNENSSVKSNSKIFCICDEMHELEKRYADNKEFITIINSLKLDKYSWNYNRLNKQGQKQFKATYLKELTPIIKSNDYIPALALEYSIKTFKEVKCGSNILQKIFSIKNSKDKSHKIITIVGLRLKFKKQKQLSKEKI